VHALLSLQVIVFAVNTQPVAESHESSVQRLPSLQVIGLAMQAPAEHASVVHALPSLHAVSVTAYEHTPPEQEPIAA